MSKIVAFSVPTMADGEEAIERLEELDSVQDVALVFKNDKGKVKIRQTSDLTAGKGALRGGLIGAVASIFAGPLVGVTAAGAAAGAIIGKIKDGGVSDSLMKLAGEQLEAGQAAVFVLADDEAADAIVAKINSLAHLKQFQGKIEVGSFSADAQKAVRDSLRVDG